ncbi:MAG: hypothetical protein GF355_13845 [Candidatus Eisenbacteria bacterium]|nr:hypothetical protein [Candidatus Eisenbacteria bacterium]
MGRISGQGLSMRDRFAKTSPRLRGIRSASLLSRVPRLWAACLFVLGSASAGPPALAGSPSRPVETSGMPASEMRLSLDFTDESLPTRRPVPGGGSGSSRPEDGRKPLRAGHPVSTRWVLLPDRTNLAEIIVEHVVWDTLTAGPGRSWPPADSELTRRVDLHPAVKVVREGYLRGIHIAQLAISPVQVLEGEIPNDADITRFAARLDLIFRLEPLAPEEEKRVFRPRREFGVPGRESDWQRWIRRHAVNPELLETAPDAPRSGLAAHHEQSPYGGFRPTPWPALEGPAVAQVIITDDATLAGSPAPGLVAAFSEYAAWKTQRGMPTIVARVQEIVENYPGFDVAEKLKSFIHAAARDWGTQWFLLGGDVDVVPTRRLAGDVLHPHERADPPADIYYVRFGEDWNRDGDAYFWDDHDDIALRPGGFDQAWIGRLPCRTAVEAQVMIDKIRSYMEPLRNRPGPDYYESVLLATGPVNDMNPYDDSSGYPHSERVLQPFRAAAWSDTVRLYATVDDDLEFCDGEPHQCYAELKAYLDSLDITPWTGSGLRDHMQRGYHIVWHLEHSTRTFLGDPTVDGPPPRLPDCSESGEWQQRCRRNLTSRWGPIQDLYDDLVLGLTNGAGEPRYSIVFCGGSYTSEFDRDAVGEAFLRAPAGGAVAYVGKPLSLGGYGAGVARSCCENLLTDGINHIGTALSFGILEAAELDSMAVVRAKQHPLLGDPAMRVWPHAPDSLRIAIEPAMATHLGPQPISVLVTRASDGAPAPGATVCLMQASESYGLRATDSEGRAGFPGYPVATSAPISVSVRAADAIGAVDTLRVEPAAPYLAYDTHTAGDAFPFGDGDGVPEAGESVHLRVILRNLGGAPADTPRVELWPSPAVQFHLEVDGEERSDRIHIGAAGSRPAASRFNLPPAGEGFRAEGEPPGDASEPHFRIWRDPGDGAYHLAAESPQSEDALLTGVIICRSGFESVSWELDAGDDSYEAAGDSLRFSFTGDATPDRLRFAAGAARWAVLHPARRLAPQTRGPSVRLPGVDPGDTLSTSWRLELKPGCPDDQTLVFSVRAAADSEAAHFSDFTLRTRAPHIERLTFASQWTRTGTDTALALRPLLRNGGGAAAESIVAVLRRVEGDAAVSDSIVRLGRLEPGAVADPEDRFLLQAATAETILETTLQLILEAQLHDGSAVFEDEPCRPSGEALPAPQDPIIDAGGRALHLRWDPVPGAVRYLVEVADEEQRFVGVADSTARMEVTHIAGERIDPYDGDRPASYSLRVRACDAWSCGEAARFACERPWLPNAGGWPRYVDEPLTTAPKIIPPGFLADQAVVFVAGRRIYAWLADGTPLRSGEAYHDGLFYDPGLPQTPHYGFTTALTLFQFEYREDILSEPVISWGLAGNIRRRGMIVLRLVPEADGLHYRPELQWSTTVSSLRSSPVAWNCRPQDYPGCPQLFLPADNDTLYAWSCDGTPLLKRFPTGAFAAHQDGSWRNLQSLALAHSGEPQRFNVIQSSRTGHLICWEVPLDRTRDDLAQPSWDAHLEAYDGDIAAFSLSSPAVGDVDGDRQEEVVVTNQNGAPGQLGRPGRVWVLDARTGKIEARGESWDWSFRTPQDDYPAPRPVLANVDGGTQYEIVLAGRVNEHGGYVAEHRVHILSVEGREIVERSCRDEPVLPSRNSGNIGAAGIRSEPVAADIDGDGALEIVAPSTMGALFAWEPRDTCRAEEGWPMLFGEPAMTPAVEDLDGDADLEMVVAREDGIVHILQLPARTFASNLGRWNQYASDSHNSARVQAHYSFRPRSGASLLPATDFLAVAPLPFQSSQRISVALASPGPVTLRVYDVAGRRIRTLAEGDLPAGRHHWIWDGFDDDRRPVGSGVYFYRLEAAGGRSRVERTVRLR